MITKKNVLHARHDHMTNYFQYKGPCCDLRSTSYLFRIAGNKKNRRTLYIVWKNIGHSI